MIKNKVSSFKCFHKGCGDVALYPAPKDALLKEYIWFCLEHIRLYNASWNYGQGWSYKRVDDQRKKDEVWQRKTTKANHPSSFKSFYNSFSSFRDQSSSNVMEEEIRQALKVLGFDQIVKLNALKKHYRELVKLYHPDKNGGCKQAEEKLKLINKAYTLLCEKLT